MTKFFTEADLAEELGGDVTDVQVAEWRRRYGWPCVKIGRQIRFTEADLLAIAAQHHAGGLGRQALPDQTPRSAARAS